MFRSMTSKVCLLFTLVALAALPSVSRASGTGSVMLAGYANYGTAAQTYVNVGITDYGPLATSRYGGQIVMCSAAGFIQARALNIVYSGGNTATITYVGMFNGLVLQFGQITATLTSASTYKGLVGVNSVATPFSGSVWVVTL